MIKIFNPNDDNFDSNGNICIDAYKCVETKKRSLSGWYIEVECASRYKRHILQDHLCVIKTKSKLNPQAFRISNIKFTSRRILFQAHHVMFDAHKYFLLDVRPTKLSAIAALNYLNQNSHVKSPFKLLSNVNDAQTAYFIRKTLFEAWQVMEERWNGVFDADNFTVTFNRNQPVDKGATLTYGSDLQNVEVYEDWSQVVTTLYPTGPNGLMLPERFLKSKKQYSTPYVKTIQFESKLEEENPKEEALIEELRNQAMRHLTQHAVPMVSYTVKSDVNQELDIGDLVVVKHPLVFLNTEVQEYVYDVGLKRVKSLVFGNYTRDVKQRFEAIQDQIKQTYTKTSELEKLTQEQTKTINQLNKTGKIYIDDHEILVLDALPKEKAKNVWRFGLGGLGFSKNGYEGPFEYALTQDGRFNSSFIGANSITANMLQSDIGSSLDLFSNEAITLITQSQSELQEVVDEALNKRDQFQEQIRQETRTIYQQLQDQYNFEIVKLINGIEEMKSWFRIDENGAIIGKSGNSVSVHIGHNVIEFIENGVAVAVMDNQKLRITSVIALMDIIVGNHIIMKYPQSKTITIIKPVEGEMQ